jgi:hypothetical protein
MDNTRNLTGAQYLTANADIVPIANNSIDLGSTSQRFRNIYTNGLNTSGDIIPEPSDTYSLGSETNTWDNVYAYTVVASNKVESAEVDAADVFATDVYAANVHMTGPVFPTTDNTRDLGTSALRWRNIYKVPHYTIARMTTGTAASGAAPNMTWDTIDTNSISGLTYSAGVWTYVGADIVLSVSVYAQIAFNTTGVRNVTITSTTGLLSKSYVGASSGSDTIVTCSTLVPLTTGQQLWFVCFQNSGSTLAVTGRCTMYQL